jgi:hypothetical protein
VNPSMKLLLLAVVAAALCAAAVGTLRASERERSCVAAAGSVPAGRCLRSLSGWLAAARHAARWGVCGVGGSVDVASGTTLSTRRSICKAQW